MKKKKLKKYRITLYDVIVVAVFSVLALLTLYPFYNVLIMSLSNTLSVAKHTPYLLPYAFDLTGYKTILQDMYFLKAFPPPHYNPPGPTAGFPWPLRGWFPRSLNLNPWRRRRSGIRPGPFPPHLLPQTGPPIPRPPPGM